MHQALYENSAFDVETRRNASIAEVRNALIGTDRDLTTIREWRSSGRPIVQGDVVVRNHSHLDGRTFEGPPVGPIRLTFEGEIQLDRFATASLLDARVEGSVTCTAGGDFACLGNSRADVTGCISADECSPVLGRASDVSLPSIPSIDQVVRASETQLSYGAEHLPVEQAASFEGRRLYHGATRLRRELSLDKRGPKTSPGSQPDHKGPRRVSCAQLVSTVADERPP